MVLNLKLGCPVLVPKKDDTIAFREMPCLSSDGRRPPMPLRRDMARDAITHVMTASCAGRFSLSTYDRSVRVYPIDGCDDFQVDSEVSRVAGHDVTDGDLLYDAVAAACEDGSPLTFESPTGVSVLTATCEAELSPRAPWMTLTRRR